MKHDDDDRRALCIADRPTDVPLAELVRAAGFDVVLLLGDLTYSQLRPLEHLDLPKLGVYGNHCAGSYFEALGVIDLHLRTAAVDGITFGGFEGCHRYKARPRQWSQEETEALLADFPRVDVMVCHSPPEGVNDDPGDDAHVGLRGLRAYVERHDPALLVHGHTYPSQPSERVGRTEVRYVSGHRIVTLPRPGDPDLAPMV